MLKRDSEIVLRKVGSFYFLIDPKKSYNSEQEDIFQTNEIGAAIWGLLENHHELSEVHKALLLLIQDEIDDDLEMQIKEDIMSFVEQLKHNGFVAEV